MRRWGGSICIVMLLFVGLLITPAMGSIMEAGVTDEIISVEFIDFTGKKPVKNTFELPESEWITLKEKLREVRQSGISIEDSMNAQFALFKEYNFVTEEETYHSLMNKAYNRFNKVTQSRTFNLIKRAPIENIIINAMCSIFFELASNSTSFVFGLNTFINLIGFDIVSVHNGYAPEGITARQQEVDPGEYIGAMFGFLGYWAGTDVGTGKYTDLEVAGFTIFTFWFPSPV
jgi:hypothetical protein